jgi:hypothetical protein
LYWIETALAVVAGAIVTTPVNVRTVAAMTAAIFFFTSQPSGKFESG